MGIENMENTNSSFDRGIIDKGHREIEFTKKGEGEQRTSKNVGPGPEDIDIKDVSKPTEINSKETPVFQELKEIDSEKANEIEKETMDKAEKFARKETIGMSSEAFFERYEFLSKLYKEELAVEELEKRRSERGKKPIIH